MKCYKVNRSSNLTIEKQGVKNLKLNHFKLPFYVLWFEFVSTKNIYVRCETTVGESEQTFGLFPLIFGFLLEKTTLFERKVMNLLQLRRKRKRARPDVTAIRCFPEQLT